MAAKAEVLALLETMPHFWDAQQLLLELVDAKYPQMNADGHR